MAGFALGRNRQSGGSGQQTGGNPHECGRTHEIRMLAETAAQLAPVISEARTLDRFVAPGQERLWSLARNLWWSWDHDSTSLFYDLDPLRWQRLNHNPIVLLSEIPLAGIERRANELVLWSWTTRGSAMFRRQAANPATCALRERSRVQISGGLQTQPAPAR